MVDGPFLKEIAADDDGAAEGDDKAQQGEGCVALHAADDSKCLFHYVSL